LLAVWFGWGSTYDAIRVGVRTIPPFTLAASRHLVAGAVSLPLAARGIPGNVPVRELTAYHDFR
jgi:drug/metabolite transporter (DMT)-like permease